MDCVCGDFHGSFKKVNQFLNKKNEISTIFQCGDFGFWPRERDDNISSLKNKDVKIYWCDGNHEDHESLKKIENNEIIPNVFYMKRGSVLTLEDGRNVLFIGGAYSIDKLMRTPGRDWFPEELITQKDIYDLPDINIDIVISHTGPREFKVLEKEHYKDPSRDGLSHVLKKYKPKLWYFGHMHLFKQGFVDGCKWTCLSHIDDSRERWWVPLEK